MDTKATQEYIERRSEPCPATGCWLWTGQFKKGGYPVFRTHAKSKWIAVHRLSLIVFKGLDLTGLSALHHCDNPACVNPNHLYAGTPKDNVRDMFARGRNRNGAVKKEFCKQGHALTPENRVPPRNDMCRICHNARQAKYVKLRKEKQNAPIYRIAK